jgi:hypothetical protein
MAAVVAVPADSIAKVRPIPLSKNRTYPLAFPAPGKTAATVAVKVIDCPKSEGFTEDVNAVVVLGRKVTTWLTAELVLVTNLASPE